MIEEDTQHGLLAATCLYVHTQRQRQRDKEGGREVDRQTDRQILRTLKGQNLCGGPRAE